MDNIRVQKEQVRDLTLDDAALLYDYYLKSEAYWEGKEGMSLEETTSAFMTTQEEVQRVIPNGAI